MNSARNIEQKLSNYNLIKLTLIFVIAGVFLSAIGLYLWYSFLYLNYDRRFWIAIENSLALPSVTRTIESGGSGNQAIQRNQINFAPSRVASSYVTFDQKSATELTQVITEGVSYTDAQYSRYVSFATNKKNAEGSVVNLDDYLGKWEENTLSEEGDDQFRLAYMSELVTLVIFGNFDTDFRRSLVADMQQQGVYEINRDPNRTGVEEIVDGRRVINYSVSVKVKPFVELLNKSFMHAGFGEFPPLDPSGYSDDAQPLPAQIVVDKKTNQVVGVNYGERSEKYTGHGIVKQVSRPEGTFKNGELEQRVSERLIDVF